MKLEQGIRKLEEEGFIYKSDGELTVRPGTLFVTANEIKVFGGGYLVNEITLVFVRAGRRQNIQVSLAELLEHYGCDNLSIITISTRKEK